MDIVLSTHSPAKQLNFYKTFGCYSSIHKRAGSLAVISTKEIKVNNGKNEFAIKCLSCFVPLFCDKIIFISLLLIFIPNWMFFNCV